MKVSISKTSSAVLPRRATIGSACYDLYADEDAFLIPFIPAMISTGLRFAVPEGKRLQIMPRSSSAKKRRLVHAGIIDSDYRGDVKVVITSMVFGRVKKGESIAQCMLLDNSEDMMYNLVSVEELGTTERGEGGFGSTG